MNDLLWLNQIPIEVQAPQEDKEMVILTREHLFAILEGAQGFSNQVIQYANSKEGRDAEKTYAPLISDLDKLERLVREVGWNCRVTSRAYKGVEYIVLSGYAGLRNILKGTRYKATNPLIMKFGLGELGKVRTAVKGSVFGIVIVSIVDISEAVLSDDPLMMENLGYTLSVDIVKVLIGTTAGIMAGAAVVAGATALALTAPVWVVVAATVLIGFAVGKVLDAVFPTDELVAGIRSWVEEKQVQVGRELQRMGQTISAGADQAWNNVKANAHALEGAYEEFELDFLRGVYELTH